MCDGLYITCWCIINSSRNTHAGPVLRTSPVLLLPSRNLVTNTPAHTDKIPPIHERLRDLFSMTLMWIADWRLFPRLSSIICSCKMPKMPNEWQILIRHHFTIITSRPSHLTFPNQQTTRPKQICASVSKTSYSCYHHCRYYRCY